MKNKKDLKEQDVRDSGETIQDRRKRLKKELDILDLKISAAEREKEEWPEELGIPAEEWATTTPYPGEAPEGTSFVFTGGETTGQEAPGVKTPAIRGYQGPDYSFLFPGGKRESEMQGQQWIDPIELELPEPKRLPQSIPSPSKVQENKVDWLYGFYNLINTLKIKGISLKKFYKFIKR